MSPSGGHLRMKQGGWGGGWGGGPQQAISSSVPSVVCRGTVTVWLMDSEWFATGSQELWENKPGEQNIGLRVSFYPFAASSCSNKGHFISYASVWSPRGPEIKLQPL